MYIYIYIQVDVYASNRYGVICRARDKLPIYERSCPCPVVFVSCETSKDYPIMAYETE